MFIFRLQRPTTRADAAHEDCRALTRMDSIVAEAAPGNDHHFADFYILNLDAGRTLLSFNLWCYPTSQGVTCLNPSRNSSARLPAVSLDANKHNVPRSCEIDAVSRKSYLSSTAPIMAYMVLSPDSYWEILSRLINQPSGIL